MIKGAILLFVASIGVAVAAPLRFYVVPGSGFAMHQPPLWVPDAAALAAAEQRAEQAGRDYAQGLGSALECAEAQLEQVRMQEPLWQVEVSTKIHRSKMFAAARQKLSLVEKMHENGLLSDEELYKARFDDAWLRARHLAGGRDPGVYEDKLKTAALVLEMLESLVNERMSAGHYDLADVLLVQAAQGEVKLALNRWQAADCVAALASLEQTYDQLAKLMTTREKEGLCEAEAAASAREAVRLFRCHADLEAAVDSPERVAALKDRYDTFAVLVPLILQRAEKRSSDASVAPRQLERMRQAYESTQKKLQNK